MMTTAQQHHGLGIAQHEQDDVKDRRHHTRSSTLSQVGLKDK